MRKYLDAAIGGMLAAIALGGACGGGGAPMGGPLTGGNGGHGGGGIAGAGGGSTDPHACPDIFAPMLQTYGIDIAASDWAAIQNEFMTAGMLMGNAFAAYQPTYYPVVFHYGSEIANAHIRLRGDSSWREAVQFDGANGKMQFSIAFDQADPNGNFHGVSKIKLDMPRTDPTFMRERFGSTWLRALGIPSVCATSGNLVINGAVYGVFVAEEHFGHHTLKEFFPGDADGDLFDGGWTPQTNQMNPNNAKLRMFWDATTPAALQAVVDVPGSVLSWAAEALLNDADGYWGGDHNFYLYDQGAKGYVFIPHDLDSTLDYLGRFDSDPITWWSVRPDWMLPIPQHYLIVMGDDAMRAQYVEALRTQLGRFDVGTLQSWFDTWASQIRDAVAADPHKGTGTTVQDFDDAVALARRGIADRADYVSSWLSCRDNGGADKDGDGFDWCHDCRDDIATVNASAPEICGNLFDDNCNGLVDEGCQ